MSEFAQAYTGLQLTVNGFGYVGALAGFEPPLIKETTEDHRGGRIAPVKMFTGYEAVEAKIKLNKDDVNMAIVRAVVGRDVVMTVRATTDERGKSGLIRWDVYGRIIMSESGEIKAGDKVDLTYTVSVEKFVKTLDGVPAEAFDVATGELKFSTTDVLADIKSKLGL